MTAPLFVRECVCAHECFVGRNYPYLHLLAWGVGNFGDIQARCLQCLSLVQTIATGFASHFTLQSSLVLYACVSRCLWDTWEWHVRSRVNIGNVCLIFHLPNSCCCTAIQATTEGRNIKNYLKKSLDNKDRVVERTQTHRTASLSPPPSPLSDRAPLLSLTAK